MAHHCHPPPNYFPPNVQDGNYANKENFGKSFTQYANVEFRPHPDPFVYTSPVMSFRPNPFGLYDMGGNVAEVCDSASGGRAKLLRGAHFCSVTGRRYTLLASIRTYYTPEVRTNAVGFRVVLAPNSPEYATPPTGKLPAPLP